MAVHDNAKAASARPPLDYYGGPDRVQTWKLRLTWLAGLVTAVWLLAGWIPGFRGETRYSHGPLTQVHATWDAECQACHDSWHPLSPESWANGTLVDQHHADQRCQTCHAGPVHHSRQFTEGTPTCADCHREHGGRHSTLLQMPDELCTRCHADLAAHTQTGAPAFMNSVRRFDATEHPNFAPLGRPDPGKLKFNHKLHLTAGMVRTPGARAWTLGDIADEAERTRYRQPGQADNSQPVQLDCTSCHRTGKDGEITRERFRVAPARSLGEYMLPIVYEDHCRACHPLTFDPQSPNVTAPHRLQPEALHAFLEKTYAAQYLSDHPKLLDQEFVPRRPIPGKSTAVEGADAKTARTLIASKIEQAERILYAGKTTCGECHEYVSGKGQRPQQIVPPELPEIWLPHARFNHASHRAVDCRLCHGRAYSDHPQASQQAVDVLIPGQEVCLRCHAPSRGSGEAIRGGARADCAECHRYHSGDQPLQGIGGSDRQATTRFSEFAEFLRGQK